LQLRAALQAGVGDFPDIQFEEKYPINDSFGFYPNIDVVIHNDSTQEFSGLPLGKFSEAYGA
jgi:hypothetical protein